MSRAFTTCVALARLCEPIVTSRVLVIAAHPDDETIGAGGLLARSLDAHVAVVTDGAPRDKGTWPVGAEATTREEYAAIRREELRLALADAGLGADRLHLLELTDGEATEHIPAIVARLVQLLEDLDPSVVLTHAYEGGHVDHDATALAVAAAMALAGRGHHHEMALYHGGGDAIAVHEFLPDGPPCCTVDSDDRLRALKSQMLGRYRSQRQYDIYFGTALERFRCAPVYDFRQSPALGRPLLYERTRSGITGEQWRALARAAIEELKLAGSFQHRSFHPMAETGSESRSAGETPEPDSMAPLVSVIVRTLGRDTLVQALDSIARQTYPNIEVVLVDVGGDGPPSSWEGRSGVVLRTRQGIGFDRPKAANAGLAAATGDYIAFLDDDDWWHPEHLASLVTALRAASDARVAYTGVEVLEWPAAGSPVRRWMFDAPYDPVALLCENYIPLNAVLLERGLVAEGSRFDEALPLFEDWDFLIRLSRSTRFLKVPGMSAVYRWPPGSGVNDPRQTGEAQELVFTKWRGAVSREDHIAVMRRAIEQTELKDGRSAQLQALQVHLKRQDEELDRLRPCVSAQEAQLQELRTALQRQKQELDRGGQIARFQDRELAEGRERAGAQDREITRLTETLAEAERRLAETRRSWSWRLTRPVRVVGSFFVTQDRHAAGHGAAGAEHARGHVVTPTDRVLARLVALKIALAYGGRWRRRLVPAVEAVEVLLSAGPSEVLARARLRLGTRRIEPPPEYAPLPPTTGERPALTLPPMSVVNDAVSIVIPVFNNTAVTYNCLAAIATHTTPGTYEVIVVDNASEEDTRAMLGDVHGLRVIRNEANAGFVEACNQGAAAARGEHVLFLNNDTAVLPGWLDALVGTLAAWPDAGAVGARLLFPDGRLQEAGNIIWNDGLGWNYGKFGDPEEPEFCHVRDVDYCSGACLLVPRHLFEKLGGFDLRYAPAYYEDTDLCFRLREQGYSVLYQPASRVVHLEGATAGIDESTGFKQYQMLNRDKFIERHRAAVAMQYPHDARLLRRARDRRPGHRILVVDHMLPHHDQDSGSVRMAAILQILVELGHAVTFLPDNLARIEPYATELQQRGIEVLYGPMSVHKWLEAHISEFDVAILCRAYFAAKHMPAVVEAVGPRPFLIFDTVDLHYLREERLAELKGDRALRTSAEKTREVELAVMRASDMVWVTSTHEAGVMRVHDSLPRVEVVPNVHHVRLDTPGFAGRKHLLFIGGFTHPPNEDAVLYFVEHVLPLVTARLPDVQLLVVGSNVTPSIRSLASPHVVVLGYVKDVAPLFDACLLSVAPLRYGAGVKGKITQSLAWGLPVVTTLIGAEGLDLVDREHVMIASDPMDMAARIIELHEDEALWQRLAENGRRHVHARLGYESVRAHVGALLQSANIPTPATENNTRGVPTGTTPSG